MDNKPYFIYCGNWSLCMYADKTEYHTLNDLYIELATRAVEVIFSDAEFTNTLDDYYALLNEYGENVLDREDEWPMPTFTTVTHIISEKDGKPYKLLETLRTADLFANASLNEYYLSAIEAEKEEQ